MSQTLPHTYAAQRAQMAELRTQRFANFAAADTHFIPGLAPQDALRLPVPTLLNLLQSRLGRDRFNLAIHPDHLDTPARQSPIPSPVQAAPNGTWLRRANLVGINLRTVGSIVGVLQYTLTLPAAQNAIHLLPIWRPGVLDSLYGPSSWTLNPELHSPALAAALPWLDTPTRQLKATIHLLHALGRTVGVDVIPHTDRYSEMALAFPEHFEWLIRDGLTLCDHRADLHQSVQRHLLAFLATHGTADSSPLPTSIDALFAPTVSEARRTAALFGPPTDLPRRDDRRLALIAWLRRDGYEPVPATMAPPYRGLQVDPAHVITDPQGLRWRDFRTTHPTPMSRVFGPLTRYKFYDRKDNNRAWEIDFTRPRAATWDYLKTHIAAVQQHFGFDFMRGDMSHVQMRPQGVPTAPDAFYDPLRAVKEHVRAQGAPHFAYFAESFLAPDGTMAYGNELDHLEASHADVTLGNLQSIPVGTPEFLQTLRRHLDLGRTRRVSPALCLMTADKDDPRFDAFYQTGGAARMLLGLFITDAPSYMALGFASRDIHLAPAPNAHDSKRYVFRAQTGPMVTFGPYTFGQNGPLFRAITHLRLWADRLLPKLATATTAWLLPPDPTGASTVIAWTQAPHPRFVFVAQLSGTKAAHNLGLPSLPAPAQCPPLTLLFSTHEPPPADQTLKDPNLHYRLQHLAPDECRIYAVASEPTP